MPLHPPSGWRVFRIPDPPFPNDLITVVRDDGKHTTLVKSDQPLLWDYFASFAVLSSFAELTLIDNLKMSR